MAIATPTEYNFSYSIIVCIDASGTLKVYWAETRSVEDPSNNTHQLIIEKSNWDGSAVTQSFNPDPADLSNCINQNVKLTATQAGTSGDGSVIVDVDYESICDSPNDATVTGTETIIVNIGDSCPLPVPE